MDRDQLAIEVTKELFGLYEKMSKKIGFVENGTSSRMPTVRIGKNYLICLPSIKDERVAFNCTPWTLLDFIKKVQERTTIKQYVLSVSWIYGDDTEEEYNDKNKISVIISDESIIKLNYQKEMESEEFDCSYNKIKEILSNNTEKQIEEKMIKREKPIRDYFNFGILGKYQKKYIVFEDDNLQTTEESNKELERILEKYNSNLNIINGKILYKMFDEFVGVEPYIWELNKEQFNNILNGKELPSNFEQMSNLEKCNIIFNGEYGKKYVEDDYMKIFNERFPYFDYDKFVDNFHITNVNINSKFGIINIEFKDKTTLFNTLMVINYNKDFEIVQFSNG